MVSKVFAAFLALPVLFLGVACEKKQKSSPEANSPDADAVGPGDPSPEQERGADDAPDLGPVPALDAASSQPAGALIETSFELPEALPCFADSGSDAGDDLKLKLAASRVSGVAPLAVFFDTLGTTSASSERPFHELGYCWDFGDPDSGRYGTTGLSKNEAKGAVAGHVFEEPGTYTVTVSARDAAGRVATRGIEITVDDPDRVYAGERTVCYSASGDFEGCPVGGRQITSAEISSLAPYVATGRRLLLRRGDTFTGSTVAINVPGPGTIGAFGRTNAALPRIEVSSELFTFSDREPSVWDWRVMDLDLAGQHEDSRFLVVNGKASDLLVLRATARDLGGAVGAGDNIIDYWNANGYPGHDVTNLLAIQDCDFRDVVGGAGNNILYVAAHRMLLLGNNLQNSTGGEHVVRVPWIEPGVISNNDMGEAPRPRHLLKLHAVEFGTEGVGQGKYSERVLISDNVFRGTGGHDWSVAIGPQNKSGDERARDIVVERNLFLPGTAQVALVLLGQSMTVRNNVFNRGAESRCVTVERRGVEPAPDGISLVHNTCLSEASRGPILAGVSADASNVSAYNNLAVGASVGNAFDGPFGGDGGNLAIETSDFGSMGATDRAALSLEAPHPAIDSADSAHAVFWDFGGQSRPADGDASGTKEADVGALERSANP